MADLNKIINELSKLTVVEAADLSKQLEEKWGVTAAAPVVAAAATASTATSSSTPTTDEERALALCSNFQYLGEDEMVNYPVPAEPGDSTETKLANVILQIKHLVNILTKKGKVLTNGLIILFLFCSQLQGLYPNKKQSFFVVPFA